MGAPNCINKHVFYELSTLLIAILKNVLYITTRDFHWIGVSPVGIKPRRCSWLFALYWNHIENNLPSFFAVKMIFLSIVMK